MKKILAMLLCCVMLVAMFAGMSVSATEESATDAAPTPDGYYAALGVQTCTTLWIFRNAIDDATYGYGMADANGTVAFDGLSAVDNATQTIVRYNGTFTDAKLDGDGTYTVSLVDPDFADEQYFSIIMVSTNVPLDSGITFSNVKVRMNGKTVLTEDEAFQNPDAKVNYNILLQNQWNAERTDLFQMAEPCNTQSLEVSFDVSGFGYWAEGQEPVEEPAVDEPAVDEPVADEPADDTTAEGGCTGAVAFPAVAAVIIAAALVIFKKRA